MAVRKTRQPPPAAQPEAASALGAADAPRTRTRRRPVIVAAVLFAGWGLLLATLAVRYANPVTLNREQIRHADVVVEALVVNVHKGRCDVVRTWPPERLRGTITVVGLNQLKVEAGEGYLFPLRFESLPTTFKVVRTASPESEWLIYPATADARRQLEAIVAPE